MLRNPTHKPLQWSVYPPYSNSATGISFISLLKEERRTAWRAVFAPPPKGFGALNELRKISPYLSWQVLQVNRHHLRSLAFGVMMRNESKNRVLWVVKSLCNRGQWVISFWSIEFLGMSRKAVWCGKRFGNFALVLAYTM